MNFKNYLIYGFFYIIAVAFVAFFYLPGDYRIDFLSYYISLPIAIWAILPLLFLYSLTLLHLGFYSVVNYLRINSYKNDFENFLEVASARFLGASLEPEFKNKEFKLAADILLQSELAPSMKFKVGEPRIDKTVDIIHQIYEGKYVDLSRYNVAKDSSLFLKNSENRLKDEPRYAEEILRNCEKPTPLCIKAYEAYVSFAELKQIKKIDMAPTKSAVMTIFGRFSKSEDGLEFETEYAKQLCEKAGFGEKDFVELAKTLIKKISPDKLLELFYLLSRDNTEALGAYIYINLELEVIDNAKVQLENSGGDEFLEYKAFLCMKESGKNIKLSSFLQQLRGR